MKMFCKKSLQDKAFEIFYLMLFLCKASSMIQTWGRCC